jgi:hypothetical protein
MASSSWGMCAWSCWVGYNSSCGCCSSATVPTIENSQLNVAREQEPEHGWQGLCSCGGTMCVCTVNGCRSHVGMRVYHDELIMGDVPMVMLGE